MVERRKLNSSKNDDMPSYAVGRAKPPKHSQFKPGQSGNPAGRPKGLHNLKNDVKKTLSLKVKIRDGDGVRTRSMQEAILMVLGQKASLGDLRAITELLQLAARFNAEPPEMGAPPTLESDDKASHRQGRSLWLRQQAQFSTYAERFANQLLGKVGNRLALDTKCNIVVRRITVGACRDDDNVEFMPRTVVSRPRFAVAEGLKFNVHKDSEVDRS